MSDCLCFSIHNWMYHIISPYNNINRISLSQLNAQNQLQTKCLVLTCIILMSIIIGTLSNLSKASLCSTLCRRANSFAISELFSEVLIEDLCPTADLSILALTGGGLERERIVPRNRENNQELNSNRMLFWLIYYKG